MRHAAPLAAAVAALVLLAGCSTDAPAPTSTTTAGDTGQGSTTSGPTPVTCPPGERWLPPRCTPDDDGATFAVRIDAPIRLEVPLPHLDRCVSPQEWAAGNATTSGPTWTLRTVNRGTVLQVVAESAGIVELGIDLTGRPVCQTLRHDPWSIDPDPAERTLEVSGAGGTAGVTVTLRHRDGPCIAVSVYNGTVAGTGWQSIPARAEGQKACA